jgi:hypothetical protein
LDTRPHLDIAIDIDHVTAILLADGWHEMFMQSDGTSTFTIGRQHYTMQYGTASVTPLAFTEREVPLGFTFHALDGTTVSGPLSSVLAVRETWTPEEAARREQIQAELSEQAQAERQGHAAEPFEHQ